MKNIGVFARLLRNSHTTDLNMHAKLVRRISKKHHGTSCFRCATSQNTHTTYPHINTQQLVQHHQTHAETWCLRNSILKKKKHCRHTKNIQQHTYNDNDVSSLWYFVKHAPNIKHTSINIQKHQKHNEHHDISCSSFREPYTKHQTQHP